MVSGADDLGAWLVGLLADAARSRLKDWVLGTDQERALRAAAATAVERAARELRPDDAEKAAGIAMVTGQAFSEPLLEAPLAEHATVLEALQAGIARQVAVLGDASLTGTGQSSAEVLDVRASVLAETLTGHLVREIVARGARGGPLEPLAAQLNHDITHLQNQQLKDALTRLEVSASAVSDADRTAGQRRAELDAVAAYRARLASRDGVLEYSLLADDLPPMTYKPLADSLRVSVPGRDHSDEFLRVARRWPRMLLAGLPGMGKSTALEQAAARWAADSRAPVPLLVPLRDVAGRQPRRGADVTLPVLIEAATPTAPQRERQPLRRALEHAVSAGEAVLLLDGLDECRELRGVVADGLAEIVGGLPPDTGVVLATRDSGLPAARKLKLAEAQLVEPAWLELALSHLMQHAATSRGVPQGERDRWVGDRRRRLDELRRGHPDLWRVPLLATLLTLLATRREPAELPASRARLLAKAVRDTVNRWELSRLADPPPYPHLREHVLEGYNEIAHTILSGSGGCPKAMVKRQVAAMLAAQWGLAPAEARTHAGWVLWFWDEHVGVFVGSPATGDIKPRSRVFAEAGDAMWAAGQDSETRREWITDALTDGDRREPVVLAASLSPDVANELIEAASHAATPAAYARALWWAADAAADGAEPSAAARGTLLGGLEQAAREAAARVPAPVETGEVTARKRRAVRPGWEHVLRITMLPLPGALRSRRDAILAGLVLYGNEQALAAALTALADARADSRDELASGEAAAVSRLLDIPLPERKPPATTPEGAFILPSSSELLLGGQFEAAEQAASYAPQLGQEAVDAIYRIAHRGSVGEYERVVIRLTALGYPDPEPMKYPDMTGFAERMTHVWDGWEAFLTAAASLAPPGQSSLAEGWRYPHLAAVADVLDAPEATLDGIDHALTTNQTMLPGWLRATAHAAGLDLAAISAQAAAALNAWSERNQDVINIMFAPPPSPPPACDPARLDPDDVDVLIEALGATSQWLADTACILLETAHDFAIGERAEALIPLIPPDRRQHATQVAIANNPSPPAAAGRLLDSPDPLARVGAAAAARALAGRGGGTSPWTPVLARARADDDLTVQLAAADGEAGPITAARWTCLDCGGINEIAAPGCAFCASGRRPGGGILSTP